MSANEVQQESNAVAHEGGSCSMESVNRISKLPVVESTIQTATSLYEKVKDYNSFTNWTMSTAESTVNKAIEVGKPLASPVVSQLEGSIKKVDGMLCTGLDYVETKVPAVKLPPGEMYTNTKDYVNNTVTPAVQSACALVQPAVQSARVVLDPAVQSVRQLAEPLMQPAVEKAYALKDYGAQKVGEYLNQNSDAEAVKPVVECADCLEHVEKKEKQGSSPKSSPKGSPQH